MTHDIDIPSLVSAWIADAQLPTEDHTWRSSYYAVKDLVNDSPEVGWPILLALLEAAPSPDVISLVGAGPLEDALAWRHDAYLERVVAEAGSNPRLRQALRCVQLDADPKDGVPESVLEFLEASIPGFTRFE